MSGQAITRSYGFGTTVGLAYPDAIERTRAALKQQGFGVLTGIDVRQTLRTNSMSISVPTSSLVRAIRRWPTEH